MASNTHRYIGRFAPSPTGPLHAGSVVAALGSFLDARAHRGQWKLRIEDTDTPRTVQGAADRICQDLQALGLLWDGPVRHQSDRSVAYEGTLAYLLERGLAYPCACTRKEIEAAQAGRQRHQTPVYPGLCRHGIPIDKKERPQAYRFRITTPRVQWQDRSAGAFTVNLPDTCGDFTLRRADGIWTYQLAVVVDDADQGITDVVRGMDLLDSTARQIALQKALAVPRPRYLHLPLVNGADGQKLSKQNGALPIDVERPLEVLQGAAKTLGMPPVLWSDHAMQWRLGDWLQAAVQAWADHMKIECPAGG